MRNILPRASCVPGGKHARKGVFRTLRCGILSSVALSATISQLCSAFSVSQTLPTRGVCISLDCYRYTAPIFFPARQSGEDNRTPGKGRCLRLIWASFFFQKSGLDLARERGGEWQRLSLSGAEGGEGAREEQSNGPRVHPSRCKRSRLDGGYRLDELFKKKIDPFREFGATHPLYGTSTTICPIRRINPVFCSFCSDFNRAKQFGPESNTATTRAEIAGLGAPAFSRSDMIRWSPRRQRPVATDGRHRQGDGL
jgi:hypothetical protein